MGKLVSLHPDNDWFWIMGGDHWAELPLWTNPEILASLVEFIVLDRDGAGVLSREGYRMRHIQGEHPASASGISTAIAAGETITPHLHRDIADQLIS